MQDDTSRKVEYRASEPARRDIEPLAERGDLQRTGPYGLSSPPSSNVFINRNLLDKLQSHQVNLYGYIKGYMESSERVILCERILSELRVVAWESEKLKNRDFWRNLRNLLRGIDPLPYFSALSDLKDSVEEFNQALRNAKEQVSAAEREPQGVNLDTTRTDVQRFIDVMYELASDRIATSCREKAVEVLEQIRDSITEIFTWITAVEQVSVSQSGRSADYETKLPLAATEERERVLQSQTGRDAPSSDVRQSK